jgi:hypothetical protein
MKLYNKVKDQLEKKGYDFSDEKWTAEKLVILHDSVYTTEKVLKKQFKKTENKRNEMLEILIKMKNWYYSDGFNYNDDFDDEIGIEKIEQLIEKSKQS